jgi:hypothetical protein
LNELVEYWVGFEYWVEFGYWVGYCSEKDVYMQTGAADENLSLLCCGFM